MKSRLARLGVIVGAILGLVGVMTPPAHANKVGSVAFTGTAEVTGGLAYPCFPNPTTTSTTQLPNGLINGTATFSHANCPDAPLVNGSATASHTTTTVNGTPVPMVTATTTTTALPGAPAVTTVTLPLPNNPVPNTSTRVSGAPTRAFTFGSTLCAGTGVSTLKPGLPLPVEAGACTITASGTVHGWCGLSQAQGTATVNFGGRVYTITFHFTGIGGLLAIEGHVRVNNAPNHTSLVVGAVTAVPVPQPTVTPTGTGPGCSTGTAQDFSIVGGASFVIVNNLP